MPDCVSELLNLFEVLLTGGRTDRDSITHWTSAPQRTGRSAARPRQ